jgi:LysR family hydrogen peroxide-inducible transcriptional activator
MELHQLRYFLAVAKTGNFSRAAESCHITQPSLSQQILKLESELGEKLFERKTRRVLLTSAGELLRERAARVLYELQEARREVRDARGEPRGQVNLSALPTIAPYLLPKIIRGFARRCPGVATIVHEETTDRALRALENHEIDLALVSLPIESPPVETRALFSEELLLVLPKRHPLLRKRVIVGADLEAEKFIFMAETHCLGAQALQFCYAKGFTPQISCRSAQMETVQALVAAGVGISMAPAMARESGARVGYRSLGNPKPTRTVALVWNKRRHLSRAALELRDHIETNCSGRP